jgi:hypothetical protein
VACAATLGVVVGVVLSVSTAWQAAMLVGWDAGALLLILWIWLAVAGLDAEESRTHASREDTSICLSELIILNSGVALLRVGRPSPGGAGRMTSVGFQLQALGHLARWPKICLERPGGALEEGFCR